MVWFSLLACEPEPSVGPPDVREQRPIPADACVGSFSGDSGVDGAVDAYGEHVVAEDWNEIATFYLGDRMGEAEIFFEQLDEHGLLMLEKGEFWLGVEIVTEYTRTWTRDEQARVVIETESGDLDERRANYFWVGALLNHVEHHYDGDDLPDQVTTFLYDADGRKIEQRDTTTFPGSAPAVRTYTYLAPAPSLDYHEVWDYGADGTTDGETDVSFDEAGRMIEIVLDSPYGTTTISHRYDAEGNEVWYELGSIDAEGNASTDRTVETTRDTDGLPLEVESWSWFMGTETHSRTTWTRDAEGRPLVVDGWTSLAGEETVSRTTWSWDCP
jgi:catechol 2,3-dioxygenase-like lactoylglutathione lyase family enzyme